MATIQIDDSLQVSEEMSDFFLFLLNDDRVKIPKLPLPQILLAKTRPGLDSEIIASNIISRFEEIGIPSGPLEGGSPNIMESLIRVIAEEVVDAIQSDARVDIAVDQGMIVTSAGANAAGPVASTGANVAPHTAVGITN
jgi:hypothetical protein